MKTSVFYYISILLGAVACKAVPKKKVDTLLYKDIVCVNNGRDTCLAVKDEAGDSISFIRNFKIIENTMTDTMNVAFNFVRPGDTGSYFNSQVDAITSSAIYNSPVYVEYLEEQDLPEFYTKSICVYNWSRNFHGRWNGTGMLRIRLYYKPEKKM